MTHGSLFSGIGGFDYASQLMGWENSFHCEINPFGRHVLNYYWPQATSYDDITKTDFSIWRGRIDVLTGGFPCQPFSLAGKRKGKEDDRYLWPEMLRAIDEIRPRWVCGENVAGIGSMVQPEANRATVESTADFFGEEDSQIITEYQEYVVETVCNDLERIGYSVQPVIIPACAIGAPHRRDRIWFIANAERNNDIRTITGSHGATQSVEGINRTKNRPAGKSCRTDSGDDYRHRSIEHVTYTSDTGLQGGAHIGSIESFRKERGELIAGHFCPDWQNFPTQPPVCDGNDGLPSELDGITFSKWRNESIKALGNAIVPQVALEIFKAIQEYES
ncbi:DNA cytosine methyltransferase [Parapedobacter lycopersici]|uniref:DNA cytosine methyltransferase n=1 Tax=Parapedobacter lycopersici TaxID=1864939 RepID=UPI00214D2A73|nr:DNA cytosine methyltransferase [Parapedobacter lycopersici]